MDQIVNQMLHVAQYLEWDPMELRPVSFCKQFAPERAQTKDEVHPACGHKCFNACCAVAPASSSQRFLWSSILWPLISPTGKMLKAERGSAGMMETAVSPTFPPEAVS